MKMVEDQDTENKPPRRTRKKVYKVLIYIFSFNKYYKLSLDSFR